MIQCHFGIVIHYSLLTIGLEYIEDPSIDNDGLKYIEDRNIDNDLSSLAIISFIKFDFATFLQDIFTQLLESYFLLLFAKY